MSMYSPDFTYRPPVRPGTFLRNLPYSILQSIARQLDPEGTSTTWRDLALKIPRGPMNPSPRFTNNDIQYFELCSRQGKSATLTLLGAWSTSNPTAQDLVDVLQCMNLPKLANMILPREAGMNFVPQATGQIRRHSPPPYQEKAGIVTGPAVAPSSGAGLSPLSVKPPYQISPQTQTVNTGACTRRPIEHESLPFQPSSDICPSEFSNLSDHLSLQSLSLERNLPSFCYSDLCELTSNFNESCKLGEGAFGSVFSGHLTVPKEKLNKTDARKIAIKRLKLDAPELAIAVAEQFKKEIHIISELEHENILPLVGYSCDGPELCLVYDFMYNGSLSSKLECCRQNSCHLSAMQRIQIAEGSAAGIEYLHEKMLVHRDIKSSNILLDSETRPRISDFGLIRSVFTARDKTCTITTKPIGTPMYMAPEAHRGEVSTAMDVFGFGIVLLELLTSMPVFDPERDPQGLDTFIVEKCEDDPGFIFKFVDNSAGNWSEHSVTSVYNLAESSLNYSRKKRPTMKKVLDILKVAKTYQQESEC